MSASIENRVEILLEFLAYITGCPGGRVKRCLPESEITNKLGKSLREVQDTWGVPKGREGRHRPWNLDWGGAFTKRRRLSWLG